jgi:CheY-like chemotaxis protein
VLVVDDDDLVRVTTTSALESRGFDVVSVASGSEALAYLGRDTPSLLLLDLNMGSTSGWEVLSYVQRSPRLKDMRTIVVSGERATVPRRFGYLRKPFRLDALLELLASEARQPVG